MPASNIGFVAGRYLLRERLGSGAVGEVWCADDPQIGRRVAIKFLRGPDQLNAELRAEWENRFLLEARAAGRLSHPGIVPIFDVGTASDGRPFIVMELVEGRSLEAVRLAEPHPTLEQAIRWTIEIAEALDVAHGRGVVHRDVKPANILIGTDGHARIADFGIARVADSDLTRDGAFLGSPAFASPEQLRSAKIDGRSDLFALGAVLFLLATERRPFEGDDIPTIVYQACYGEPKLPSSLNPEIGPILDGVILRTLRKNPDSRFQTGRELAEALRSAAIDPTPFEPGRTVDRTVRDERAPAASTTEDRAVSIASAVAVSVVRASRSILDGVRRTEPQAHRVPTQDIRRAWGIAAAVIVVALLALLASRPWTSGDTESQGHAWGQSSRVNVLVEHGLKAGNIQLSANDGVILNEPLEAPEKPVLGMSFFKYRSGTETSKARLSPGHHALTIRVTGQDDLALVKTLNIQVDPKSEYDLHVSVATWPRARISADWSPVGE